LGTLLSDSTCNGLRLVWYSDQNHTDMMISVTLGNIIFLIEGQMFI